MKKHHVYLDNKVSPTLTYTAKATLYEESKIVVIVCDGLKIILSIDCLKEIVNFIKENTDNTF